MLTLAATTATLRMIADKHYFTDVLVGAAVGSAAGFLVPHLHRPPDSAPATGLVAPASGQRRVGFTLPFAAGDSRAGALTASYADGPSLTLRLVW
jgi:membrane-associated phospholipid phosphatase